jgi:hypothetical protein
MGMVDLASPSIAATAAPPSSVTPGALEMVLGSEQPAKPRGSILDVAGAIFRSQNEIASAVSAETNNIVSQFPLREEGFDAWEKIKGTPLEKHWSAFVDVFNQNAFDATVRQVEREQADNRLIFAAPWYQKVPLALLAEMSDPANLFVPGGAFVKGPQGGISILRSTVSTAALAGASAGIQERSLQDSQLTRTADETAIAVTASVFLGGILGAGFSSLMSRAEWQNALRKIEQEVAVAKPEDFVTAASPLGAAATAAPSLDKTTLTGAAGKLAEVTSPLNPGLRLMQSPSPEVRNVAMQLFEMTQYIRGNADDLATPQAVETLRKEWNAGLMRANQDLSDQFKAYRRNGGAMKRGEFYTAVGMAGRRGDRSDDPFVQAAAQSYRQNVYDPLKNEAIAVKLLPEDLPVETAESYLSRMWNVQRLRGEESEFKGTVIRWVQEQAPAWAARFDKETAEQAAKLEGKALKDFQTERRVEREARFGDDAQTFAFGQQIADEVFDKLTRRFASAGQRDLLQIEARGPLRARTFLIPDEYVERWLESDAGLVARRYTHIVGNDVEMTRKFGSSKMIDQLGDGTDKNKGLIRESYDKLIAAAKDDKTKNQLREAEKRDIRDLEGVRDIMRGTYASWDQDFDKIARVANAYQYIVRMGQVTLSSIGEPIRIAMSVGLMPFVEGTFHVLTNLKGVRLSASEAKLAGNINDQVLSHRLATLAEITDVHTAKGPVETFLANMTDVASKWNGIRLWTDLTKTFGSVIVQNRLLTVASDFAGASAKNQRFMRWAGIDEAMAARIGKQFEQHGHVEKRVKVAGTEKWTDPEAVRAYRAALNKDLDSLIVTRSVADIPLLANTPLGRMIFQFQTFNLASHQRLLLRGMEEGRMRLIGGMIAMASVGMLQTYLSAVSNNRVDKLPDFSENPGWWLAEGIDRSGVLSVFFQVANGMEKLTGYNPVKAPMTAFDAGNQGSERLVRRNELSLLGPSAGTLQDLGTVAGVPQTLLSGEDLKQGQKNAAERLMPFSSYLGLRQMMRYIVNPPE